MTQPGSSNRQLSSHSLLHETNCYEAYTRSKDNQVVVKIFDRVTDATPALHPQTGKSANFDDDSVIRLDYWEEADEKAIGRWKRTLGESLIAHVVQPAVMSSGRTWLFGGGRGFLEDLPNGYKLFVRLSGDKHAPRKDYYLKGSRHANVFRTPQEFFPHLLWLIEDQPMRSGLRTCQCRYCDHKPTQTEISRRFGFRSSHSTSSTSERSRREAYGGREGRRSTVQPLTVPAKDYTKLNLGLSSSTNIT